MQLESTTAMESYVLESTRVSPQIRFLPEEGLLELRGRSSPEHPLQVYQPLIDRLERYVSNGSHTLIINFELDYFNTSSSKCIYEIFKKAGQMGASGKELIINWFYEEEDEDMIEQGEDFANLLDIEFNFKEVES
ncbi:MAG: DUF1987 domain-containing protein [Cyclobacteriaceae bacterium]